VTAYEPHRAEISFRVVPKSALLARDYRQALILRLWDANSLIIA
jgi:hypothetical protein